MSTIESGVGHPISTSLNPPPATQEEFNRYVFDNPAGHISGEKFKEVLYKTAAIGSMVILGAAIVVGVVALMHTAPISVPFFLILAGAVYKVFHSKVFTYLKEQGDFSKENALRYEGMSHEIEKVKQAYVDYNSYHDILRNIGLYSTEIPVEALSTAANDAPYLKPLANLIGRVKYWENVEKETLVEIQKINEQIISIEPTPTNNSKVKAEKTRLCMQKQRLEELKLLPAKIAGAYALHILSNVKDKRDFDAFGQCHPISYLSHLEYLAERVPQPYYFFPEKEGKPPLSTAEMIQATPLQLSKRIFEDSNAFVR